MNAIEAQVRQALLDAVANLTITLPEPTVKAKAPRKAKAVTPKVEAPEYVGRHVKAEAPKAKPAKVYKYTIACADCGTEVKTNRSNQKRCTACSQLASAMYRAEMYVRQVDAQMAQYKYLDLEVKAAVRALAVDMTVKGAGVQDAHRAAFREVTGQELPLL